jgi:carboxypeptidase C (cathepsin A)
VLLDAGYFGSDVGFLQEIGPFYLPDGVNYKAGDMLTLNKHSWHNVSNLLFFESPAGVGYSYLNDPTFVYEDHIAAEDHFDALLDFFQKYREYLPNRFWIAGESYAGKYIPDLALKIHEYNLLAKQIDLRGILVGNGIMSFRDGRLLKNKNEYLINRYFADPDTVDYWRHSCESDPVSPGCRYF